jgi:hypothetical protein
MFLLLLFAFVKEAPLMWLLFQVKHLQRRNRSRVMTAAAVLVTQTPAAVVEDCRGPLAL